MGFLSAISPIANLRQLRADKESATINRLMKSRHVADLRLIFSFTVMIVVVAITVAIWFTLWHEQIKEKTDLTWIMVFNALADCGPFIGAVGVIACGIMAWTYQTGSARLGVVDLFACEIATLCRVTAVADAVEHFTWLQDHMPDEPLRFSSQESYFPVFERTTKDLQLLEEKVVKNVTEFYTYMKVSRDYMRKLADIRANSPHAEMAWQEMIRSVIYMLFLGLESARKSVQDLVEFQPTRAEETITILLSELKAYAYLRTACHDDLRRGRLQSRDSDYRDLVPELLCRVKHARDPDWKKSKEIARELEKRYHQIFLEP